jgi:hypothetical protein
MMACCVTCHRQVLVAVTDRGWPLPLSPRLCSGALAVRRGESPGLLRVRYLRGGTVELGDGERLMTCHWDVYPVCKPARKRGRAVA